MFFCSCLKKNYYLPLCILHQSRKLNGPNIFNSWLFWLEEGDFTIWTILIRSHAVVQSVVWLCLAKISRVFLKRTSGQQCKQWNSVPFSINKPFSKFAVCCLYERFMFPLIQMLYSCLKKCTVLISRPQDITSVQMSPNSFILHGNLFKIGFVDGTMEFTLFL